MQGGLIALHVAVLRQDLFTGLILSSPSAQVDPKVAGPFTVSFIVQTRPAYTTYTFGTRIDSCLLLNTF